MHVKCVLSILNVGVILLYLFPGDNHGMSEWKGGWATLVLISTAKDPTRICSPGGTFIASK